MPLKQGTSRETLLENFVAERRAGRPKDQAWAIAYETRRRSGAGDKQKRAKPRRGGE